MYDFSVQCRPIMSRVRDCCVLAGISGISGGSLIFGCRVNLDHFLAWRAAISSRYSTGESPPIKAGQLELTPHLETTCKIHHINEEEKVLISGTREKSAVGDSAPAETVSRLLTFPALPVFPQTLVFHQARRFQRQRGFYHPPDFTKLHFTGRKDLAITLTFTGRQYLWIFLYIFFSVCAFRLFLRFL